MEIHSTKFLDIIERALDREKLVIEQHLKVREDLCDETEKCINSIKELKAYLKDVEELQFNIHEKNKRIKYQKLRRS